MTQPVPSPLRHGWYIVLLLTLLFAVSLVDRFILALLAAPLSRELGLTDIQLSLLIGTGFATLYALAGVPAAHWIDSRDRRKVVAIGALLWSVTTILSASVSSFGMLLLLRAGVAIGEAVLTPAAVSMIADLFSRERRALPMSVYLSCGAVMGMGSFAIGGTAIDLATFLSPTLAIAPWRLTMIIIGIPGIILALLMFFTVKEPTRTASLSVEPDCADLRSFFRYLREHSAFYLPFLLGGGLYCLFGLSLVTWLPTILVRGHGYTPAEAGYVFGIIGVPVGLAGMFAWPRIATWIERRRPYEGPAIGLLLAALCGLPIFSLATTMADHRLLLLGVGGATFLASAWSILPPLCIQTFGPSRMRARLMALNLLSLNLIGFGFGPLLTVWFSSLWGKDPKALGYGLAVSGGVAAIGAISCYLLCLRAIAHVKPCNATTRVAAA